MQFNKTLKIITLIIILFISGQVNYALSTDQEKATEKFTNHPTKELKLEDINVVLPDYTDVNNQYYDTIGERMMAEAQESYKAHARQIEHDMKYYTTKKDNQNVKKEPQNYALAMLEARRKIMEDDSYDWSREAMLRRAEKPIYQYPSDKTTNSFSKANDPYDDLSIDIVVILATILVFILMIKLFISNFSFSVSQIESSISEEKTKDDIQEGKNLVNEKTEEGKNKPVEVINEAKQNDSKPNEKKELENKIQNLEIELLKKKIKELEDKLK